MLIIYLYYYPNYNSNIMIVTIIKTWERVKKNKERGEKNITSFVVFYLSPGSKVVVMLNCLIWLMSLSLHVGYTS